MPKRVTPQDILMRHDLDSVDKRILQLKLEYPAMTINEIATVVGIKRQNVTLRIARTPWQKAYNDYCMPAKDLINAQAERLTKKYIRLCDSKDEKTAERAMRTILYSLGVLKRDGKSEGASNPELLIVRLPMSGQEIRVVNKQEKEALQLSEGKKDG